MKDCEESYLRHTVKDTSVWTWKDTVIMRSSNVLHKLGFLDDNVSPPLGWFKQQQLLFQLPSAVKFSSSTFFESQDFLNSIVRLILCLSDIPHKSQCFYCGQGSCCPNVWWIWSNHRMWKAADQCNTCSVISLREVLSYSGRSARYDRLIVVYC